MFLALILWGSFKKKKKKKKAEEKLLEVLSNNTDEAERNPPPPAPTNAPAEPCRHGGHPWAWTRR